LNGGNLRFMQKLCASFPGISLVVSAQLTVEICASA